MLTKSDIRSGPPFLIVATRWDGYRLVLAEARQQATAEYVAESFRSQCRQYRDVVVERVGVYRKPGHKLTTNGEQ